MRRLLAEARPHRELTAGIGEGIHYLRRRPIGPSMSLQP